MKYKSPKFLIDMKEPQLINHLTELPNPNLHGDVFDFSYRHLYIHLSQHSSSFNVYAFTFSQDGAKLVSLHGRFTLSRSK